MSICYLSLKFQNEKYISVLLFKIFSVLEINLIIWIMQLTFYVLKSSILEAANWILFE